MSEEIVNYIFNVAIPALVPSLTAVLGAIIAYLKTYKKVDHYSIKIQDENLDLKKEIRVMHQEIRDYGDATQLVLKENAELKAQNRMLLAKINHIDESDLEA